MRVRLTSHAREQMQEQEDDVTEEQIQKVLHDHHTVVPGGQPTTIRYVGFIEDNRQLSVVAERPGVALEPVKIITVYWEY